jgi:hypothetical protein
VESTLECSFRFGQPRVIANTQQHLTSHTLRFGFVATAPGALREFESLVTQPYRRFTGALAAQCLRK